MLVEEPEDRIKTQNLYEDLEVNNQCRNITTSNDFLIKDFIKF